ncbi:hypothetical protein Glove_54g130 [Diversispora epigaea]|uniref:Retrotransposon gag domain-containing protein n=1 Tax=Diversispora epigaea TaxID=1348612 RepID=A0A397JCM7_9GLOM|nr:hypothetical protein Glove_54g130 [Diversispora epigaea]
MWIRDNILIDNGRTVFNILTRRTVQRLTPEEREQRRQLYRQQNQNPVTVRLPASNSTTTSPSATVEIFGTTPRRKRQSNETPQNFNLFNQQLAEAHLTASDSSDSSDTEDEMANIIIDYLEDNLHNHTSLRVDPFYGDGTQDPFQWMLHFEKVAHSNAWDEAKKIRKTGFVEKYYNTRWKNKWLRELENNCQRQEETINAYYIRFKRLVKPPATLAAALEKAQAYEEGLDMVNEIEPRKQKSKKKVVESSDEEEKEEEEEERKPKKTTLKKKKKETKVTFDPAHNLDDLAKKFEKMQLNLIQKMEKLTTQEGHISWNCPDRKDNSDNSAHAKLVEVEEETPATLAAALEKAQAYEEGLDMVNEIEPRKQKSKKKVVESSDEEEKEEEEEERKPKKTTLKKKKKETKVTFDPAHNLDDLAKKFEKMQLNLIQKMEKLTTQEGHISWNCPDRKDNSDNSAHAKLVEVEEEKRDDSSDEDTPIKRPRETNIPEPKPSLNTFDLPKTTSVPIPKVVKTEITPKKKFKKKEVIKIVKGNKEKKKENAT